MSKAKQAEHDMQFKEERISFWEKHGRIPHISELHLVTEYHPNEFVV